MSINTDCYVFDYRFKIIIIGDVNTGKTSLACRFSDHIFHHDYRPTIGVDFKVGIVTHQDKRIKLQIWDTAGQERFRTIINNYYRGVSGVLLCFCRNKRASFDKLEQWIEDAKMFTAGEPKFLLVSCKNDLEPVVTEKEITEFCERHRFSWLECSAKTGYGVQEAFTEIGTLCLNGAKKEQWDRLTLQEPQSIRKKYSNCCRS